MHKYCVTAGLSLFPMPKRGAKTISPTLPFSGHTHTALAVMAGTPRLPGVYLAPGYDAARRWGWLFLAALPYSRPLFRLCSPVMGRARRSIQYHRGRFRFRFRDLPFAPADRFAPSLLKCACTPRAGVVSSHGRARQHHHARTREPWRAYRRAWRRSRPRRCMTVRRSRSVQISCDDLAHAQSRTRE